MRRRARGLLALPLGLVVGLTGLRHAPRLPPPPDVAERARAASRPTARSLRVSLQRPGAARPHARPSSPSRGPDALRIEIPGPTARACVAVTRDGRLTAVFPGERAVFEGDATPAELEALLGVALAPAEVMDLLVGAPLAARSRDYRARWGPTLPRALRRDAARRRAGSRRASRTPNVGADAARRGLRGAAARRATARWTPRRRARLWERALSGAPRLRVPSFAKVNLGLEVLGPRAGRLPRAAHALPDHRPARRHRARAARRRRRRSRCDHPRVPAGRDEPGGPRGRASCARFAGVPAGRRDRDHQAHPRGGGPGRRQQQRGRGAAGPGPPLAAGPGAARPHPAGPPPGGRRAVLPARGHRPGPRPRRRGLSPPPAGPGPRGGGGSRTVPRLDGRRVRAAGREFDTPGKQ